MENTLPKGWVKTIMSIIVNDPIPFVDHSSLFVSTTVYLLKDRSGSCMICKDFHLRGHTIWSPSCASTVPKGSE